MNHSISTTVVSCDVVVADCDVVVEFTDGALRAYSLTAPLGGPSTQVCFGTRATSADVEKRLRWLTPEQVRDEICRYNAECRQAAWNVHDARQRQRLGEDYRQRGYR